MEGSWDIALLGLGERGSTSTQTVQAKPQFLSHGWEPVGDLGMCSVSHSVTFSMSMQYLENGFTISPQTLTAV